MPGLILQRKTILVPAFLAAQALLVHWAAGKEYPPAPPKLSSFPVAFEGWKMMQENPIEADVAGVLRADALLSRTYAQNRTGPIADLFVAWFQSQRDGTRQPHSPQVCLPASGWVPEAVGDLTLDTKAGAITVNRYLVANRTQRAVVLYWYQTPRRVTAGEWAAKVWLVADALRDRRTDTALVRIVVTSVNGQDAVATSTAAGFARTVYPILREQLPK